MRFQTDRLDIRPFQNADYTVVKEWFQDPDVMRYSMGLMREDDIRQWLRASIKSASGPIGHAALVLRATNECIGYVSVTVESTLPKDSNTLIGYRLRSRFWGMGYATEAVRGLLAYSFHALGVLKICATIDPANIASIRVAEKVGMTHTGSVLLPGYSYPDALYTIASAEVRQ